MSLPIKEHGEAAVRLYGTDVRPIDYFLAHQSKIAVKLLWPKFDPGEYAYNRRNAENGDWEPAPVEAAEKGEQGDYSGADHDYPVFKGHNPHEFADLGQFGHPEYLAQQQVIEVLADIGQQDRNGCQHCRPPAWTHY